MCIEDALPAAAAELDDVPPVAFRGSSFRENFELPHRLPFGGYFFAQFPAVLSFAIERLRHRGRPTYFAEKQHLHLKVAAVIGHAQSVPHPDFTRRLCGLSVRQDSAQFARSFRQRTRLEKSRRPQLRIHSYSYAGHNFYCATRPIARAGIEDQK